MDLARTWAKVLISLAVLFRVATWAETDGLLE